MTSDTGPASTATARASWSEMEEFDLLDKYLSARNDASLATDNGLKSKAWNKLVAALNAKHHRILDKGNWCSFAELTMSASTLLWIHGLLDCEGQYKSMYTRLMKDYDRYKYIRGLSGAGVCPDTGKPTLDDDVWERLMTAKPKQRAKIAAIREQGFPHATCHAGG
ncbi:hypothetical protein PHYPSEUDO_013853 [Phytophthora pseudosyringae]|uniref:Myb/SANT-like domain-containing protein n=1 Tax=Phytophthora pseudosyringae TaxID=221518 RepID=A0A8T1V5R7_9STRA|nr:hypothetical protein PHYPSEUDO_013853 [Phytophthora pseudosyringae]